MRSLRWAQATADSADGMIHLAVLKVLYNTHSTDVVHYTACEEAKVEIRKQVEAVRAVLQPGVTVYDTVIAADKLVVNSTAPELDWTKLLRPDDEELIDHPWYHSYFKLTPEARSHPAVTVAMEETKNKEGLSGNSTERMTTEDSGDSTTHSAESSSIAVVAHPSKVISATSSSDGCHDTCVTRGISCSPQPCRRCLQYKKNKTRCSQAQAKRGQPVSRRSGERRPAVHGLSLDPAEGGCKWVLPVLMQQPLKEESSEADPPVASAPVYRPTDAPLVSREDYNNLVEAYDRLAQHVRTIGDGLLAWARVVSARRLAAQVLDP